MSQTRRSLRNTRKVSTTSKRGYGSLASLALIFVLLIGGLALAVMKAGASWTPKLALDLEGGTQMILAPKVSGGGEINQQQLNQAVEIIRQRVDASGVSEAEITTQGGKNILVSLPGIPDEKTRELIQASAQMTFRPVLEEAVSQAGQATPDVPVGTGKGTDGSDLNWITQADKNKYMALDCTKPQPKPTQASDPNKALVTCNTGQDTHIKYILGPVEVNGSDLKDASAGLASSSSGASTGQWAVNLQFNDQGTKKFADVTKRLNSKQGVQNQFAITLDDQVVSAPGTNAAILNGQAQITGSFNEQTAQALAQQLKYGALPISFDIQSDEQVSATLGGQQLKAGLIAGLIGLGLVVLYSFFQYRALAFITILSLAVASLLTYLFVTLFSWSEGYRLSLASVAGLIVSIGITADSFIVFFERVRDELRDGRSLVTAVQEGWRRAIRTIIASDTVNFLAAIILFFLAVGNVRGFAFTLGLTTVVDLIVVTLFTYPMMQIISRTRFFAEGHPMSGLDPNQLAVEGKTYQGRAGYVSKSEQRLTEQSMTIAERKALQAQQENIEGEEN
ncbi:MAG: protein translocase subunit SecD [Micrococcaceae bacterium]